MRYINYNNIKLSKLSLGTVQFGLEYGIANKDGKPTYDEVNNIVDYLYKNGINCFDTAQDYGESQKILANATKDKDIHIISKISSDNFIDDLKQNIDLSLKDLKKDRLFGLLLHDSKLLSSWDTKYNIYIKDLKKEQKIDYFGVSIYTDQEFCLALENDIIQIIQIPFSIFDQRAINLHWLEKAKKKNKLLIIRSVFLQGLLLMDTDKIPTKLSCAKHYLEQLDLLSKEFQIDKNSLALNFVDTIAKDSLLLFGCETINQAQDNLHIYKSLKPLDNTIIDKLQVFFGNIEESIYNPTRW